MRYIKSVPLHRREQSGAVMRAMVQLYSNDLGELQNESLPHFFDFVSNQIPYKKDIKGIELVSSPKQTLAADSADCKKKSVLIASYFHNRYGPGSWRFVASSNRPDKKITHVFPQVKFPALPGRWFDADATYPGAKFGKPKKLTKRHVL